MLPHKNASVVTCETPARSSNSHCLAWDHKAVQPQVLQAQIAQTHGHHRCWWELCFLNMPRKVDGTHFFYTSVNWTFRQIDIPVKKLMAENLVGLLQSPPYIQWYLQTEIVVSCATSIKPILGFDAYKCHLENTIQVYGASPRVNTEKGVPATCTLSVAFHVVLIVHYILVYYPCQQHVCCSKHLYSFRGVQVVSMVYIPWWKFLPFWK